MTIPETNIELVFRRQDFEEIYFKDGQDSVLKNKDAKDALILALVFGAIFSILAYFYINSLNFIVPVLSFILFAITFYRYLKYAIQLFKWRKSMEIYLDSLAKIKKHTLVLTPGSLCLSLDNEINTTKWALFTQAKINEEFITLTGGGDYTFPRKSMTESEYEFFKSVVLYKMKHCLEE